MEKISVVQENAGEVGVLEEASSAALTVRLEGGQHAIVSRDQLEPLADGTLLLKTPLDQLELQREPTPASVLSAATVAVAGGPAQAGEGAPSARSGSSPHAVAPSHTFVNNDDVVTIPRVEEQLRVDKVERTLGSVRVKVVPTEREQRIAVPVTTSQAEVERIEIGRMVDAAPPIREEGDKVIISIVEEVLVVQKRLLLREEIHITRRESTRMEEHQVMLRSEHVEISRHEDEA